MAQLSPAEAIRQFDISKPTLYSDMNDGKLSYTVDDRKKRKINVAELQRLYELRNNKSEEKTLKSVKSENTNTKPDVLSNMVPESELFKKEIALLQKEIEMRKEEADKWKDAFDKAQSTADKVTLLLEHTNKADSSSNWERTLKALEQRIANQEKAAKEKEEREQKILSEHERLKKAYAQRKRELEEEKSKGFFKKLFG